MQLVIFEHKRIASQGQLRGVLGFDRERRGVPAWLGAPAPMGALEFVSPNAYAVGCILTKEPSRSPTRSWPSSRSTTRRGSAS